MITREEIIKALAFFRSVIQSGENWSAGCDALYEHIVKALQTAEPAMIIEVSRGAHGTPVYEESFFNVSLENGRHELFTLPCQPAKAQVPEGQSQ